MLVGENHLRGDSSVKALALSSLSPSIELLLDLIVGDVKAKEEDAPSTICLQDSTMTAMVSEVTLRVEAKRAVSEA